jgi:hypothetical protein
LTELSIAWCFVNIVSENEEVYKMNLMKKYLKKVEETSLNTTSKPKSKNVITLPILGDKALSRQVFDERFNELADKLSQYVLTADEIQTQRPEIYKKIQVAIESMDVAWLQGDLEAFSKSVKTIEALYSHAIQEKTE